MNRLDKVFRHITWQSLLTIVYGEELAEDLGNANEFSHLTAPGWEKTKRMSFRDLLNNSYGRDIGNAFNGDISKMSNFVDLLNQVSRQVIESFDELKDAIPDGKREFFTKDTPGVKELYNEVK